MFKVGLKLALVALFALPTFAADKPETTGLPVSELLQRASKSPLQPADVELLRAVADLVEQEHAVQQPSPTIGEPASGLPAPPQRTEPRPENPSPKRLVFRLQNAPVVDVAKALREFLDREMVTEDSRRKYQTLRQVVLVSEPVSNSLLISSNPIILDELAELIAQLDARPDMVSIEVLIAEWTPAGDENEAGDEPAFPWQREGAAAWLTAAKAEGRLNVLSRPKVMTLDNQPACIQIGSRVPIPSCDGSSKQVHVGLILGVTPRVTPEGSVVVELDLERSNISDRDGATPFVSKTTVQTTVEAEDGQTVILGGMTTTTKGELRGLVVTATPHVNPAMR